MARSRKKFEKIVKGVKKSGGARNPYAVANAQLKKSKAKRKRKSKR